MISNNKKKKTYVFDNQTIELLEELKNITGKSETRIICEALELYEEYIKKDGNLRNSLEVLLDKITELSYKLGKCQARLERYERQNGDS